MKCQRGNNKSRCPARHVGPLHCEAIVLRPLRRTIDRTARGVYVCVQVLTSNKHDADGEDLFSVRVGGHIPKTDARQRREGEVQSGDVTAPYAGSTLRLIPVFVILVRVVGETFQPSNLTKVVFLRVTYRIPYPHTKSSSAIQIHSMGNSPDAGQPVSDKGECGHQKKQYSSSIFRIPINFPRHPHQPQKPRCFQQTYEGGRLKNGNNG